MLALFVFHAFAFLRLKTAGDLRDEIARLRVPVAVAAIGLVSAWSLWTQLLYDKSAVWALVAVLVACLIVAAVLDARDRDGWAFMFTSLANLLLTAQAFASLFPFVMPTSLADGVSLDIWNAASSDYTLRIMTWVALIVTPVVLAYQGWTYWVFRKRIVAEPVG